MSLQCSDALLLSITSIENSEIGGIMNRKLKTLVILPLVATLSTLGITTVSGASSGGTVNVVGYSTISAGYSALETAFQATSAGQGVTFTNSFGASGTQAQDVVAGQPADLVRSEEHTA